MFRERRLVAAASFFTGELCLLSAAVSAFKFFAGGVAGRYGFHLGSIGGNRNFLGGAGLCMVVFAFFHMADQVFHDRTSFFA